jgi:hypothetical protein
MTIINPVGTLGRQMAATGPRIALAASVIATVASAAIFYHSLPREALLAATVTFVFVLAAVVALFAWWDPVPRRQFTYWDAAGLLTLIGVMASAMLEPGDLARLVVDTERHN